MMQQKSSDDYVIGTGETHTVQEFVDYACRYAGLDQSDVIISDPALFRPGEVNVLCANATKACDQLGWKSKVGFHDLCQIMVDADMRRSGLTPIGEGDKILKDTFPNRWWSID
jgi:GDPmannose 4,6-dehydratase